MDKRSYKDIFLDFDDTIYDTRGNAIKSLEELYELFSLGRYFDSPEDFTGPYWETNEQLWAQYSKGEIDRDYLIVERFRRPLSLGKGLDPDREFCLRVSDAFLGFCSVKPGLVDGAHELLEYLGKKYRLHLCSNGFHEVQYKKLRSSGTDRYFDTVILSEDAGVNKPDPGFYEYALRKSGARKEETIMVGDNIITDIQGARDAGIDQIFFDRKGRGTDDAVTYIVSSLPEIMDIL